MSANSIGMVRVRPEASPPSATRNFTRLASKPTSSSSTDNGTPVHSAQDSMPCVYCTVGTAGLAHSIAEFAPHSTKWIRDTDGKRMMSSIV